MTSKQTAARIYQEIAKLYPDARCELHHTNPLELLVAIMLSAQTTDVSVNKITPTLNQKYKTINEYALVTQEELENDLRHLGLYKNKAKNIRKMAIKVLNEFAGEIPTNQQELETLPGVGRKTANVFLAECCHVPRIAVDTHVSRVSTRLGFASEKDTPEKIEKKLMKLFPEDVWIDLHHKLIFFGRYFCKAKKPNCINCPIISDCQKPQL